MIPTVSFVAGFKTGLSLAALRLQQLFFSKKKSIHQDFKELDDSCRFQFRSRAERRRARTAGVRRPSKFV